MYFRLNNDVFLVGTKNAMLFNLSTNKVYLLDDDAQMVLNDCEDNKSIEDIPRPKQEILSFLNALKEENLGKFYKTPLFIDKIVSNSPYTNVGEFKFNRLFIDYPGKCSMNCKGCNDNNNYSFSCISCINSSSYNKSMLLNENLSNSINALNPEEIFFRGGDIFKDAYFYELLNFIKNIRINRISISSTVNGVSMNKLVNLKMLIGELKLYITIIDSPDEQNINNQMEDVLAQIQELKIQYELIIVTDSRSLEFVNEDINKFIRNDARKSKFSICRRQNKLDTRDSWNKYIMNTNIMNTPIFTALRRMSWCLYGVISIRSNGDVAPCPIINMSFGNINDDSLENIMINEEIYTNYWYKTKDNYPGCQECGLRYICQTCEACDSMNLSFNHNSVCSLNSGSALYDYLKNDVKGITFFSEINNQYIN